jgi:hypothetical protein
MVKVWNITVKFKAKGVDLFGHDFTGESRTWWTEVHGKSEKRAKEEGRQRFIDQKIPYARITNVRADFIREY